MGRNERGQRVYWLFATLLFSLPFFPPSPFYFRSFRRPTSRRIIYRPSSLRLVTYVATMRATVNRNTVAGKYKLPNECLLFARNEVLVITPAILSYLFIYSVNGCTAYPLSHAGKEILATNQFGRNSTRGFRALRTR